MVGIRLSAIPLEGVLERIECISPVRVWDRIAASIVGGVKKDQKYRKQATTPTPPRITYIPAMIISFFMLSINKAKISIHSIFILRQKYNKLCKLPNIFEEKEKILACTRAYYIIMYILLWFLAWETDVADVWNLTKVGKN